jgi:probable rRNA maturation factor
MAQTIDLDFQIALPSWRKIPRLRSRLLAAARATAEHLGQGLRAPATATVLLAGNAKVRQLNHDFRGIDKTTNVLSFPQHSPRDVRKLARKAEALELGDIALAYQYVVAEAKNEDKPLLDHATHLLIHGLLHLFGYNHDEDAEAVRMEKAEIKIMKSLGLPHPYADPVQKKQTAR